MVMLAPNVTSAESSDTETLTGSIETFDIKNHEISSSSQTKETTNHHYHPPPHRHFAPLSTPLNRRLQTLVVFWHSISIPVFALFSLFAITFFPFTWVLLVPYLIYFFSNKVFENGGVVNRMSSNFRNLLIWGYFDGYFPIVLHKTVDLKPSFKEINITDEFYIDISLSLAWESFLSAIPIISRYIKDHRLSVFPRPPYKKLIPDGPAYIFGYHPHGVVAMGAMGAIGTNGANWSSIFANIPVCLLTLGTQFIIPFYRDYLLALGISSVSKKNIQSILAQHTSVSIVIGGAREALMSKPGTCKLILKNRKGFVKLALRTPNVCLVPVFAFGETEIYEVAQPSSTSWLHKAQLVLKSAVGFTVPFFHARGIFNYDFGLLPYRRRIDVVVGKPIEVPYDPEPSEEVVNKWHDIYVEELLKLVETNRERFNYTAKVELL